ncbi:hypothetical protein SAMN05421640_3318 [Ekhidna lutea]|uniref:DUF5777 domain-containing protein n=1 Tax=Ekhidna lutea TaxID=447679 RepID=A0A239LM21_EKHLU|nr:DUF5777 family beta-barrel protein [Ekhidna lutea]SNT30624.1 hypothetical protein SAMN05421640_3318 [Ekhidna lutea]
MKRISTFILTLIALQAFSQDELLEILESEQGDDKGYATATFKSTRVINGHSIETRSNGVLEFIISHRFGTLDSGYDGFYGLDFSTIRLGLEYGLTDNLNIGLGRASFDKSVDFFAKYRIVRQSNDFPFTATAFASMVRKTADIVGLDGLDRNYYTAQVHLGRKFNSNFSLQISPTLIQRNLVPTNADDNLLIAIGIGSRYKVSNRIAIVTEYYPQLSNKSDQFQNAFAVGVDIETGGHVFQLHFTNAVQMNEKGFIGETTDDFWDGEIHYGFNITRVFDLRPNRQ